MMTVRNGKRLVLFAGGLIVVLVALQLWLAIVRDHGVRDWFQLFMPLFFTVLLASVWRRYSQLEALHGPDYVEPTPKYARPLLIGAAILAAVLAALAAWLISRH